MLSIECQVNLVTFFIFTFNRNIKIGSLEVKTNLLNMK